MLLLSCLQDGVIRSRERTLMNKLVVFATLFTISSCGKKSPHRVYRAPQTEEQLGIIASCTSVEQANQMNTAFRVINAKKGIIEYYDIEYSDLQEALPSAKLRQNTIYTQLIDTEKLIQKTSNTPYFKADPKPINIGTQKFSHLDQIGKSSSLTHQGENVVIAIVDTGVYYNHPDLTGRIYLNTNESDIPNQLDNDSNSYIDDHYGWDFYNYDPYPIDDNGHGTHVAGLAAGTHSGVAPEAQIMPIKVLNQNGEGDLGTIAAGVLYAIENGAHVINLSLGGESSGQLTSDLKSMINVVSIAKENDVIIVAAAGNGGLDGIGDCNDDRHIYPANIQSSNLITVAAVNSQNQLTSYSNYGAYSVHIAAPGGDSFNGGLLSTVPFECDSNCRIEDFYQRSSGTSMSTPLVAGAIALIKSKYPNWNHLQVIEHLYKASKTEVSLESKIISSKVLRVISN